MGLEITRHHFPVADPAAAMAPVVKSAEDVLSCIETSEFDRFDALDYALTVARRRCAEDPEAALRETWEAWVAAMRVGTALFISGASTDGPVRLLAGNGDDLSELPATGPTPYLHAVNWLKAYYLAVVCRDNERVDQLVRIPVSFLRAAEVEADEFVYAWVEPLQNAWFGRAETWSTLRTAFDGTDPTVPGIASAELKVLISFPSPRPRTRAWRRESVRHSHRGGLRGRQGARSGVRRRVGTFEVAARSRRLRAPLPPSAHDYPETTEHPVHHSPSGTPRTASSASSGRTESRTPPGSRPVPPPVSAPSGPGADGC